MKTVESEEATGLKQKEQLVFIETWKWKEQNPKKKVPTEKLVMHPLLQDDGSMLPKEGLWQKEGASGVHKFERYRDAKVSSKATLDDGTAVICEGQQERAFDLAAQELKLGKVMSLEDVCALPDASDAEQDSDSTSTSRESGTDDSEAERKDDEVEKPLFRFGARSAGSSAGANSNAKLGAKALI